MPLPAAILAGSAAIGAASSLIGSIDSLISNWLPHTTLINRVRCQGKKGSPVRLTLHVALATLYGMSLSRRGNAYSITATVNHRDNVVELESMLTTTSYGGLIPFPGQDDLPDRADRDKFVPPVNPGPPDFQMWSAAPPSGFSGFSSMSTLKCDPGVSSSDLPLERRIIGYTPSYDPADITEPPPDISTGNPSLIVKAVIDPTLYRGVNKDTKQSNPVKAPWLVTRL